MKKFTLDPITSEPRYRLVRQRITTVLIQSPLLIAFSFVVAATAASQTGAKASPDSDYRLGQNIADQLREASQADLCFVASGHLREAKNDNLLSGVLFPSEEIWIVSLTGVQIQSALERSISFFPEKFVSFLHISGAEVAFNPKKEALTRIDSIALLSGVFSASKSYNVAMPASLARGGLGFFDIWEFKAPKSVVATPLSKILEGKTLQPTTFRWLSKQSS